ncbi:MAG: type II toxin-antitoxin system VapC family toxin [Kiritimatiellia bacterium]
MADILLVDTDILIDAARAMPDAIAFLKVHEPSHTLAVSVITEMELLVGCRNKTEQSRLDRSLECFKIIYLQETMSLQAARLLRTYSLSHGLLIPDAFIAATALVLDVPLATKNRRDYHFIEKLELIRYP